MFMACTVGKLMVLSTAAFKEMLVLVKMLFVAPAAYKPLASCIYSLFITNEKLRYVCDSTSLAGSLPTLATFNVATGNHLNNSEPV